MYKSVNERQINLITTSIVIIVLNRRSGAEADVELLDIFDRFDIFEFFRSPTEFEYYQGFYRNLVRNRLAYPLSRLADENTKIILTRM